MESISMNSFELMTSSVKSARSAKFSMTSVDIIVKANPVNFDFEKRALINAANFGNRNSIYPKCFANLSLISNGAIALEGNIFYDFQYY